jgi:hypothetical protein
MNHAEWIREFQQILKTGRSNKGDASKAATQLLRKTRFAARSSVTDWHEGQLLGALGVLAETAAHPRIAFRAYQRLAALHRRQLNEHGHSLASALESAGIAALKAGDKTTATRLAREVVRLRSDYPDFTVATERLVSALSNESRAATGVRRPRLKGDRRVRHRRDH